MSYLHHIAGLGTHGVQEIKFCQDLSQSGSERPKDPSYIHLLDPRGQNGIKYTN